VGVSCADHEAKKCSILRVACQPPLCSFHFLRSFSEWPQKHIREIQARCPQTLFVSGFEAYWFRVTSCHPTIPFVCHLGWRCHRHFVNALIIGNLFSIWMTNLHLRCTRVKWSSSNVFDVFNPVMSLANLKERRLRFRAFNTESYRVQMTVYVCFN
jgi:hypothetical protein